MPMAPREPIHSFWIWVWTSSRSCIKLDVAHARFTLYKTCYQGMSLR